ncbi:hypothetical protein FPQ18DRAFT_334477 [Pyronema domesticum]|nr:hypothetical protein FPQ18DRAFT_334477 [Pyronema domesticum]
MESPTTPTTPKSKKSQKNKNKKQKAREAEAAEKEVAEDMEDLHGDEPESTEGTEKDELQATNATNGAETTEHDDKRQEELQQLRKDLETEREARRQTEEKLTTMTADTEDDKAKLSESVSATKKLEDEVKALKEQLASATTASESEESSQEASQKELLKLRAELEELKEQREKENKEAEERIEEIRKQKEQADGQYQTLLGRVATIRQTLGERMKADAEELAQAKQTVEELEDQNRGLNDLIDELRSEIEQLKDDASTNSKETTSLRSRLNIATQNWSKEREDLVSSEKQYRELYEASRQETQDWEVVAIEERAVRESLSDRIVELEEQLAVQKEVYEKVSGDYEKQSSSMEGLQRALQEIQEARKKELREVVENTQSQISQLTAKCEELTTTANNATSQLAAAQADLSRALPFEKEVKEKNLLIGKLRHEAVTLNDHLRKALRMLKRDNADDKIDKQLVTNVFLQFVSLQRGDAKKYEVLQLIASVLDWSDEQKEKAGLIRPGTTEAQAQRSASGFFSATLKTPPLTPFHRSPSSPALGDQYNSPTSDEKDIWRSVLDSEK